MGPFWGLLITPFRVHIWGWFTSMSSFTIFEWPPPRMRVDPGLASPYPRYSGPTTLVVGPERLALWGQSGKCTNICWIQLFWDEAFVVLTDPVPSTNYHNGNNNIMHIVGLQEQKTHTLFIWLFAYRSLYTWASKPFQQVFYGRAIRPHREAMGVWSYRISLTGVEFQRESESQLAQGLS